MINSSIELFVFEWSLIFLCMHRFMGGNGDSNEPSKEADDSHFTDSDGGLSSTGNLLLYAAALGTFILLGSWLLNCNLRSKRRTGLAQDTHPMQFEAKDLWLATRGYHQDSVIGSTRWGSLFKAALQDGSVVAIKRLNIKNSDEAKDKFSEVVEALSKLRHRNLVRILGFAVASDYKELVMEYADCKNLDQYLIACCGDLSWETRLKIATGTARALVYMHQECGVNHKGSVVHGNLKPSNIFVKMDDQEPLLSDYGISSLIENFSDSSSAFRGSCGYAAPECKRSEPATAKSDVYSYGMVLLHLLTLKRPTSEEVLGDLAGWVRYKLCEIYTKILDPAMFTTVSSSEQKKMVRLLGLALMCTRDELQRRPSMKEVLKILIEIINLSDSSKSTAMVVPAPSCEIEEV